MNNFVRSNRITSEIKAIKVNIKAVRNFIPIYKNIPDVKWFQTAGGFLANFTSKGIDTKIIYDEKGRWLYNLLSYPEVYLAFEISTMVKRNQYDNEILFVHEYVFDNKISTYLIRMKDKQSNISTLKVCEGEIVDITDRE